MAIEGSLADVRHKATYSLYVVGFRLAILAMAVFMAGVAGAQYTSAEVAFTWVSYVAGIAFLASGVVSGIGLVATIAPAVTAVGAALVNNDPDWPRSLFRMVFADIFRLYRWHAFERGITEEELG